MRSGFRFLSFVALTVSVSMHAAAIRGSITAAPGTVVRWSAPGTTHCAMNGRTWAALEGTCYYPIDLQRKPGILMVARWGSSGTREFARVSIEPFDYGEERIELPDIPQAHPSPQDLRRAERETLLQGRIFHRVEGPAQFTLPLGPPARPFPECKSFGVKRYYNGKLDAEPHMGLDCPVPEGSPVIAVADGRVVLAHDLFFAGNTVFVDHGNGLVSAYSHLSQIDVREGEQVTKGQPLGKIGSTGRSTGPHLFFAVRWHDACINPNLLLGGVTQIPEVNSEPRL